MQHSCCGSFRYIEQCVSVSVDTFVLVRILHCRCIVGSMHWELIVGFSSLVTLLYKKIIKDWRVHKLGIGLL